MSSVIRWRGDGLSGCAFVLYGFAAAFTEMYRLCTEEYVFTFRAMIQPKRRLWSNLTLRSKKPAYIRSYFRKEVSHWDCPAHMFACCVLSTLKPLKNSWILSTSVSRWGTFLVKMWFSFYWFHLQCSLFVYVEELNQFGKTGASDFLIALLLLLTEIYRSEQSVLVSHPPLFWPLFSSWSGFSQRTLSPLLHPLGLCNCSEMCLLREVGLKLVS